MAVPQTLLDWVKATYPRPRVDPEWLEACYSWVVEDKGLNPDLQMDEIIFEVEQQLLSSKLEDSMISGSGIPPAAADTNRPKMTLSGPWTLMEITSMTDVGVSAYNLMKVLDVRTERRDAGEEEEGEGDVEIDGEGPIPSYPRHMLCMTLTDGTTSIKAFEKEQLPELSLSTTPMGYKLLVKNVMIRRGVAFLDRKCVQCKGGRTEERELTSATDFRQDLRRRMGMDDDQDNGGENHAQAAPARQIPLPSPPRPALSPSRERTRSPLRQISRPSSPTLQVNAHNHTDDEDLPRRRKVPANASSAVGAASSSMLATSSSHFSDSSSIPVASRPMKGLRRSLKLSPTRHSEPIELSSDEDEISPPLKHEMPNNRARDEMPPSDDYGFDDDLNFNDDMLRELDQIETIAQRNQPYHTQQQQQQSSAQLHPAVQPPVMEHASQVSDVIILDDEEEDDKENVPVPTRKVRRRTAGRSDIAAEIIDLSD